jgi:hypothetical protein
MFGSFMKHTPSLGGKEEGSKYDEMYSQTLQFYKALFGSDAPSEIWETVD